MYRNDRKYGSLKEVSRDVFNSIHRNFRPQFFGTMFDIINMVVWDE